MSAEIVERFLAFGVARWKSNTFDMYQRQLKALIREVDLANASAAEMLAWIDARPGRGGRVQSPTAL